MEIKKEKICINKKFGLLLGILFSILVLIIISFSNKESISLSSRASRNNSSRICAIDIKTMKNTNNCCNDEELIKGNRCYLNNYSINCNTKNVVRCGRDNCNNETGLCKNQPSTITSLPVKNPTPTPKSSIFRPKPRRPTPTIIKQQVLFPSGTINPLYSNGKIIFGTAEKGGVLYQISVNDPSGKLLKLQKDAKKIYGTESFIVSIANSTIKQINDASTLDALRKPYAILPLPGNVRFAEITVNNIDKYQGFLINDLGEIANQYIASGVSTLFIHGSWVDSTSDKAKIYFPDGQERIFSRVCLEGLFTARGYNCTMKQNDDIYSHLKGRPISLYIESSQDLQKITDLYFHLAGFDIDFRPVSYLDSVCQKPEVSKFDFNTVMTCQTQR